MNNTLACKDDVKAFLDSLTDCRLGAMKAAEPLVVKNKGLQPSDLILFRINEITYEKDAPRQEALENVLSSLREPGLNFVYLLLGDESGVSFYFGLSREHSVEGEINIQNIGDSILKSSLEGNFRGSSVEQVSETDKRKIISQLANSAHGSWKFATLEGVPGVAKKNKGEETFQSVDRLVDVMLGDRFGFMVVAHPICAPLDIQMMEDNLYSIYEMMSPLAKQNIQGGTNLGSQKGETTSAGTSSSDTEGYSQSNSTNTGVSKGTSTNSGTSNSKGTSKGQSSGSSGSSSNSGSSETYGTSDSAGESYTDSQGSSIAKGKNTSVTVGTNKGISSNTGTQVGVSKNVGFELTNKPFQVWMKYFDDCILPRLDYGRGKGIFVTSTLLWAENDKVLQKLGNTAAALFSGEEGNRVPLCRRDFLLENNHLLALKAFQQPYSQEELVIDTMLWRRAVVMSRCQVVSQQQDASTFYLGNWMSVKELALMAAIPQKEVVGLRLKEEVEFGLNVTKPRKPVTDGDKIHLGNLVVSGIEKKIPVSILKKDLDRHIFIAGVTGAGKTTTCHNLLIDSALPFLVIEPAKTEYRILLDQFPDMEIFTIGSNVAPFKLNPFEFFEGENITSRVDMLKASIEAAFDMEAAIPQLIEAAIYESYQEYGWDITTNRNSKFSEPFAPGVYAFPTLSDMIRNVKVVVERQGFDPELKGKYIGSINARLQGLTLGVKGMMLNCKRSIHFDELLDKKVVLELEELRNGGEKALVIGFVMINMLEAIRRRFSKTKEKHLHITLIEEAHRLLSKAVPGDTNKQHSVETFADMLAEIRKYGESLIIADQIPNKLTPDVLKNTNTKIVHRLFARDDKDAIGDTMALSDEQKSFLSNLEVGRTIVFNGDWPKAVQVQIKQSTNTSGQAKIEITEQLLKERNLRFYQDRYQSGVIEGAATLGRKPSFAELEMLMAMSYRADLKSALMAIWTSYLKEGISEEARKQVKPLQDFLASFPESPDLIANILALRYFHHEKAGQQILDALELFEANQCITGKMSRHFRHVAKS